MLNNVQQHSMTFYSLLSQDWAMLLLFGIVVVSVLYLDSAAAVGKRSLEEQELLAWILIDLLITLTAAGWWWSIPTAEDALIFFFVLVLMCLRPYTRWKFYCYKKQRTLPDGSENQRAEMELRLQISTAQAMAIKRLLSRIPGSNVFAGEGDSLEDIGHTVEALQKVAAALKSAEG